MAIAIVTVLAGDTNDKIPSSFPLDLTVTSRSGRLPTNRSTAGIKGSIKALARSELAPHQTVLYSLRMLTNLQHTSPASYF